MMKVKKFFVFILALTVFNTSFSQDFRQYIKEGDKQFDEANYYCAAWFYKKAMQLDGSLYDVIYKYAEASRMNTDYNEAEKYYLRILEDNKARFPLALFWLGDVQKSQGQYQKAQKNFSEYLKLHENEGDYFAKKSKREILSCETALVLKFDPTDVNIIHIDTSVNTVNGEYAPNVITDSVMFYSSLISTKNTKDTNMLCAKIFMAKNIRDTIYAKGVMLDTLINSAGYNVINPFFHTATQTLYYSKSPVKVTEGKSQIYRCTFKNNHCTSPERLPDKINKPDYSNLQPSIAKTKKGDIFMFVSDCSGGSGMMDIWYAPLDNDGNFGDVRNLGIRMDIDTSLAHLYDTKSKINSPDDDISPFYDEYDSTLYFSSQWHNGLGGFDIFKVKGDFNKWGEPQNMGYPVNSSWNDIYYTLDTKGKYAFFASNRKGSMFKKKETCCNDIWTYKVNKIRKIDSLLTAQQVKEKVERQVKVFEKEIKQLVPLTLYFDNDYPNPKTKDTVTTSVYDFLFDQYMGREAEFRTKYSKGLSKTQAIKAVDETDDFFLNEVQKGYDGLVGFTQLMEELLSKNQVIVVTMKGYCSPLNTFDYNKNLAKRRISSLMNYFMEYKGGLFKKYVDNKQLILEQVPIGKLSNSNVSEDLKDQRNSVYSPAASLERKIQIIAVQLTR
ncbi:MAG: tetratricopeptide repeat protein [Bacteroidia bacterium]|nr:tetratricopeptide repeat protein [Bacteroidia bacterium]